MSSGGPRRELPGELTWLGRVDAAGRVRVVFRLDVDPAPLRAAPLPVAALDGAVVAGARARFVFEGQRLVSVRAGAA